MADNFKGRHGILLQPNDAGITFKFSFDVCSSSTANDGFLAYGDSISSCVVSATTKDGVAASDLISSYSVDSNDVLVALDYPSTSGAGRYHLTFVITTDLGDVIEADFNRVLAKDL